PGTAWRQYRKIAWPGSAYRAARHAQRTWRLQRTRSRCKPPTVSRSRLRCPGTRLAAAIPQGFDLALRLAGFALDGKDPGEQVVQPALIRWQRSLQYLPS